MIHQYSSRVSFFNANILEFRFSLEHDPFRVDLGLRIHEDIQGTASTWFGCWRDWRKLVLHVHRLVEHAIQPQLKQLFSWFKTCGSFSSEPLSKIKSWLLLRAILRGGHQSINQILHVHCQDSFGMEWMSISHNLHLIYNVLTIYQEWDRVLFSQISHSPPPRIVLLEILPMGFSFKKIIKTP